MPARTTHPDSTEAVRAGVLVVTKWCLRMGCLRRLTTPSKLSGSFWLLLINQPNNCPNMVPSLKGTTPSTQIPVIPRAGALGDLQQGQNLGPRCKLPMAWYFSSKVLHCEASW